MEALCSTPQRRWKHVTSTLIYKQWIPSRRQHERKHRGNWKIKDSELKESNQWGWTVAGQMTDGYLADRHFIDGHLAERISDQMDFWQKGKRPNRHLANILFLLIHIQYSWVWILNLIWPNGHLLFLIFVVILIFFKCTIKYNVIKYLEIVGNWSQKINSRILLIFLNDSLSLVRLG